MGRNRKKITELSKSSREPRKLKLRFQNHENRQNLHSLTDNNYGQSKIENPITLNNEDEIDSNITRPQFDCDLLNKTVLVPQISNTKENLERSVTSNLGFNSFNDEFSKIENNIKINDDPLVTSYVHKILQKATVEFNLSRTGVSAVLKKIHPFFPRLATDYRSLLGTPRTTELRKVNPGHYLHLGIKNNIISILNKSQIDVKTLGQKFLLDTFVDGVAIFNISFEKSFWVILGRIHQFKDTVFPIGIYNGHKQPSDFNDLLLDFATELGELFVEEITFQGVRFSIELRNFLLDSPAKASVCGIIHPTGYSSCLYCKIKGEWIKNRVTFMGFDHEKRTNDEFKNKADPSHHKKDYNSILVSKLNVNVVSQCPPDYLHVVLLGVVKKLLRLWFQPLKPLLPIHCRQKVSASLKLCNEYIPSEIHRKCRPVEEILTFHGNELRVFLLKVGPTVLRNNVSSDFYQNFLLLHCAITILCDEILSQEKSFSAEKMLEIFIENSIEVYGEEFVVSVVHACTHLAEAVRSQKMPLDSFSTFQFESYMTPIKNYLHTTRAPLQQIHRRIVEMIKASHIDSLKTPPPKHLIEFGFKNGNDEYKSVTIEGVKISSCDARDRFLLTKEKKTVVCLKITSSNSKPVFKCRELLSLGDFYTIPINSTKLDIYWCATTYKGVARNYNVEEISRKMFAVPFDEYSMVLSPLKRF